MIKIVTRREFLKFTWANRIGQKDLPVPDYAGQGEAIQLYRVTADFVRVRKEPDSSSEVAYQVYRDDLIHGYYDLPAGIGKIGHWIRTWGGYVYCGYLQPVTFRTNDTVNANSGTPILTEISAPYIDSILLERAGHWRGNYRLYYGSTHWAVDVVEGPDQQPWYEIRDWYKRNYYAPAKYMRPITDDELTPIHPNVPRLKKWVVVSIGQQRLQAFEDDLVVLDTRISSGLPLNRPLEANELPTETPYGDFFITVKTPSRHMGSTDFSDQISSNALPGVPWVSFFDKNGFSLHGTFWHNNFGTRMSHGCVNMRNEDAKWVFRWALPEYQAGQEEVTGWGIRVTIAE